MPEFRVPGRAGVSPAVLGILPKTSGGNGARNVRRCARQDAWHGGQDARPPRETAATNILTNFCATCLSLQVLMIAPPIENACSRTTEAASARPSLIRRPLIWLFVLLAAVVVAYAPALNGQFLWDDTPLVRNNQFIRSPVLALEAFRHTLFDGDSNFYRPTQTLSFIADYWAWDLDPFGYHLTNILIHALNACLLFLVLRGLLPRLLPTESGRRHADAAAWMAFGVTLVWALHPVHSAAVAYVSGRADTLAMFFCLSAWLACDAALAGKRAFPIAGWSVGAFVCLLLGLCSKEIAVVWLVIFFGLLLGLRPEISRRHKWTAAAGGLLALACYMALRHLPAAPPPAPPAPVLPAKWLLMIRALGDYGSLMLFPDKLFMERQVFAAPGLANPAGAAVYAWLAVAGVLLALALLAGAAWPGRGRRLRCAGAAWFAIGFLPISNLFSLNASVAEHWLYLPSIGFLLFLLGVCVDLPLNPRRAPALGAALILLAAAALGLRTYWRCFDWRDELTFFRQTIADGGDVPRARDALATAYSHVHDDAAATAVLRKLAVQYPKVLSAHINLATALARQGQPEEAVRILEKIMPTLLQTGSARAVVITVHVLDELDKNPAWPGQRRRLLAGALQHFPNAWDLVQLAAQDLERAGENPAALALIQRFAAAHWWDAPAHFSAGCVEEALGRTAPALAEWTEAARLDVHDAGAPGAAAALCFRERQYAQARDWEREAVQRQPDSPRQHALFAQILARTGDAAGAAEQLAIARQLVN
jgi:tetratricopeptide (TPR) repeat protein